MADKFQSDQAKAEALDNARPFDVHKWSDFPEVNNAITQLYNEVTLLTNTRDSERIKTKHIKIIALDLYVNWFGDPDRYVSFHRSKTAFTFTSIRFLECSRRFRTLCGGLIYFECDS